jgi:ABC-2 type transport system permease protein
LSQPVLFLALFGPLLVGLSGPGLGGDASWRTLVPGLLMQMAIFGAGFAGFNILQELREGVIDRQRVTPASRLSLISGRMLTQMAVVGAQSVILVIVAIPFGLKPSWDGVAASLVLICILALGISAASFAIALIVKDEESFAPVVQAVTLPLMLLSGVFLPMSLGPQWLQTASKANPFTHVVDATRLLFDGEFGDPEVLLGVAIAITMGALLAVWGARVFQRQSA